MALLEFRNVTVLRDGRAVLHRLSLTVAEGEHVAIVGPNGAGKSTLLKVITRECYPVPAADTVCRIYGRERWNVAELRGTLGIVSHDLGAALRSRATAADVVLSGFFSSATLEPRHEVTDAMRSAAEEALAALGATRLAGRALETLSSGELQRVTIARALVHAPKALVFDEPSNSLDIAAQRELRDAMRTLAERGIAIVLVTHHLADVIEAIGRVAFLADGRIVADGAKEEMLQADRLSELFGVPVTLVRDIEGTYHVR
jgi:iron complex transport system ATP-binding protein